MHGDDEARLGPVVADLRAQLRDMRVYGAAVDVTVVAPDVIQEALARDRLPLVLDEVAQQVELAGREVQPLLAAGRAIRLEVEPDVGEGIAVEVRWRNRL